MTNKPLKNDFHTQIIELLINAKNAALASVSKTMVITYFQIGKKIFEEEQLGKNRAGYGKELLENLSKVLIKDFGRGFSRTNLIQMKNFYLNYKMEEKSNNFNLTWSHYLTLIRIDDLAERKFYEIEAEKSKWSVRELKRQYNSALYLRIALSQDKEKVKELSKKGLVIENPRDIFKDPYILEFTGLTEQTQYSENDLEQAIIDKLAAFLLELGSGFTFVARQKRITFDDKHFKIDLVFYNRILRCFVLFDLKIGELQHKDIGQMQMYVNYYDREMKLEEENNTIGIILCRNKSEAVVKYTLPENNEQIFASKYKTILPKKEDLKRLLDAKNIKEL